MDDNDLQYLYTVYLGRNNSHPMKEHHLEDRTDFIIPAGTHAKHTSNDVCQQGVVTPIGPVLTTATAVKVRSRVEFQPLLVNGQACWSQLANLITRGYPKSRGQRCKIGTVKRSRPFWPVKILDRGRRCEYRTNWSDHPLVSDYRST